MPETLKQKLKVSKQDPLLITGPCSAESFEQLHETAKRLKTQDVCHLFRAGLWKPRTSPNAFKGIGAQGLDWLIHIEKTLNIKTCTEVVLPSHVHDCLRAGIQFFWIGTRTTVNPFLIDLLADTFRGVKDIHILIKNPIHPDLNVWLAAAERFYKKGIENISFIHRGFAQYPVHTYRYDPIFQLVETFKKIIPECELIFDPSHIAGELHKIKSLVKIAQSMGIYDGYMIESHYNPLEALSDKNQQILPSNIKDLFV